MKFPVAALALVSALGLSGLTSVSAFAGRSVQQGFDRSQCSNGMCTIVRVLVELNSSSQKPVVRISRLDFYNGSTNYSYDTVVQRADEVCTKDVVVPVDVFNAVANVFRSISSGGSPSPVLTPTQQTLVLFYTTLLQQTQGFECTARDLGDVNIPDTPVQPPAVTPAPGFPISFPPISGNNGFLPPPPQPYLPGNTGGVIFQ